ncbi:MAG: sulfite exporter TauE/SafE family protein [Pseudomonadota bacterium]
MNSALDPTALLPLLLLALLASYVQSVAGFALGMIMMAVAGGLDWYPVATLAGLVTLLSLANIGVALRGAWRHVDLALVRPVVTGQVLAIGIGLWLLYAMSSGPVFLLKALLGLFIALGSLALAVRPTPFRSRTRPGPAFATGLLGGLVGGLFAAAGPVIGWFMYRQPLPFVEVRATLLACFLVSTVTRTTLLLAFGLLTPELLWLLAMTLPVVLLGSWLGSALPPPVKESTIKQAAFVVLVLLGIWIVIDSTTRLLDAVPFTGTVL